MLNCHARSALHNPFFPVPSLSAACLPQQCLPTGGALRAMPFFWLGTQVFNVAERSFFSNPHLSFTSECGRSCILNLNGVSYRDGVYLFIPQTEFDCSSFVRYQSVSYARVVSKPRNDKLWSWNFQNSSLQIDMAHSSSQISDGKRP